MGPYIAQQAEWRIAEIEEVDEVEVDLIFEPPWNPDMMTNEARKKLGFDTVTSTKNTQEIETEWD